MKNDKLKSKFKNVLVTGGAGFIGGHLVDKLVRKNYRVVVIDDFSSGRKENINSRTKFYKTDIRDKKIFQIFKKEKPDFVFHLAAKPIVEEIYKNPLEAIETNIIGTANVLEASRSLDNLKGVIVVSSDKVYGKTKPPYKETTPFFPDHPYEVSKAAADLEAQCYFRTYGLPVVIVRFSNVFGPRDIYFNRIIPGIFKSILKNQELLIRSDGKMIREYIFIEDIVDGCLKAAENIKKIKGEAFNFGSKHIFSVLELIKKIEAILDIKINYKILNIAKNEIPEQYLDWSKAKEKLNWRPKISFEEGIKKSFKWYQTFFK